MHYVAPLMAEAWEQHHRRRFRLLLTGLMSLTAAALIWWATGGTGTGVGGRGSVTTITVRPSAILARSPYMGVAVCHPSSASCYRIGLAVWLKRPARSVAATSIGTGSSLSRGDRSGIVMVGHVRRREFIGFSKPAGLVPHAYLRTPDVIVGTPVAVVRLTIRTGHGKTFVTRVRVPVQAGWG